MKQILALIFAAHLLMGGLLFSPQLQAQISPDERAALIALYTSTQGDNWFNNSLWLDPEGTECDWHGIYCHNGSVIAIHLRLNNLQGTLPEALSQLQSLRFLSLAWNGIGGGLPEWLGDLPALEAVDLNENPLGGTLPAAVLQSPSLEKLWLRDCELEGPLPDLVADTSGLQGLWLTNNDIDGPIPPSLSLLTQLRYLWLGSNQFTGSIPEELGQLQELVELDISENLLTGNLPASLRSLEQLQYMNLAHNDLDGSLAQWVAPLSTGSDSPWTSLIALDLSHNRLNGPYPSAIAGITNLRFLRLNDNELSGELPSAMVPLWIPGENELFPLRLDLRNNAGLTGTLPLSVAKHTLVGEMEIWHDGTDIDFGECWGLRQVNPPLNNEPGEPVRVSVRIRSSSAAYRAIDAVPEGWDVVDYPFCYCTLTEPVGVFSPRSRTNRHVIFNYRILAPHRPELATAGQFAGELVSDSDPSDRRLICGDDRGWVDSIFFSRFTF